MTNKNRLKIECPLPSLASHDLGKQINGREKIKIVTLMLFSTLVAFNSFLYIFDFIDRG